MNRAETVSGKTAGVRLIRPHDLLWIANPAAFAGETPLPFRSGEQWQTALPVVVRRDHSPQGLIPVGIRGRTRSERAAAWIFPEYIVKTVTPESLVSDPEKLAASPFAGTGPVKTVLELAKLDLPWIWGVTGSCAYALATGLHAMHADSDLDMLIRCPEPATRSAFSALAEKLDTLPCRTDIQIETPAGAFALREWLRETGRNGQGRVLLKTDFGPVLTADPWDPALHHEGTRP